MNDCVCCVMMAAIQPACICSMVAACVLASIYLTPCGPPQPFFLPCVLLFCVPFVVQHPWVTLGGSAPLVSIRQQEMAGGLHPAGGSSCSAGVSCGALEATQEEIDAAIQQIASGGVSELMDVVFEEKVLQPG